MPWKVKSLMSERHEFCELALMQGSKLTVLCKHYGISRKTGYKWLKRYLADGYDGLCDHSRRPHRILQRIDPSLEGMIVHLHQQYPYWGARKLHALMVKELPSDNCVSLSTVSRILKRHGLVRTIEAPFEYDSVEHFERPFANDLWQMDLKDGFRLPNGQRLYPVGIVDDHSRYLVRLELITDCRDITTLWVWINAAREYGLPNETLTDHGIQFGAVDESTSAFHVHLWACGVGHTRGRVAHPQTQGKIERFWRTLKHEVISRHSYSDQLSWQHCFDDWRYVYNHIRPHQAINDEVPVSRYVRSSRTYEAPDQQACIGLPDSIYRRVGSKGQISFSGKRFAVGRGFRGWCVELRPLGTGIWHVYFRNGFVKELKVTP